MAEEGFEARRGTGRLRLHTANGVAIDPGRPSLLHLPCDGALLYPAVGDPITLRYRVRDHEVLVKSIDLTKDNWQDIHDDLLAIPMSFGEPSPASWLAA